MHEQTVAQVDGSTKTVGRRRGMTPRAAIEWNASMIRLAPDWARRRPRGVYRFKTWEDLEQWERKTTTTGRRPPT